MTGLFVVRQDRLRKKRAKKHNCKQTLRVSGIIVAIFFILGIFLIISDIKHVRWIKD